MTVLLMNQFFWPDAAATSQLLTDVARRLVAEGHDVHVICGASGYSTAQGQKAPPVCIHRVAGRRFSRGTLGRLLSYSNFYLLATWRALRVPRPDVVVTLTTPPLLSLLGNLVKLARGSRHVVWEMDMYPDVAVDLNYFGRGGFLDRVVGALADVSRAYADTIIALGECMRDRLAARGVPTGKIEVADNWADSTAIPVLPKEGDSDRFVLLYSGNLGLAHDLETVEGAMQVLRSDPRFSFVFVGSGGRRQELSDFAKREGITSLQLRPYVAREGLARELAQGDVGLVLQNDACCGSIVPSKVYGLLAAGRPLLFVGPAAATPARIIRRFGCGWHVPCGNVSQFVSLLQHLASAPGEVRQAALKAREALVHNFDLELGTARVVGVLCKPEHSVAVEQITAVPNESRVAHLKSPA